MNEQFDAIESLLRAGNFIAARKLVRALAATEIARNQVLRFATLARRADLPLLGLRALNGFIYPEATIARATDAERVEYAASLVRMGASAEALQVLDSMAASSTQPDIGLIRAYALSALWRYDEVVRLLRDVLSEDGLADSLRMALTITLTTSLLMSGKYDEVAFETDQAAANLKRAMSPFLQASWFALSARSLAQQKNWTQASILFEKASQTLVKMGAGELFLNTKWAALANGLRDPNKKNDLELNKIRQAAHVSGHGESLREIDFLYGLRKSDQKLFNKLYYGTRFRSFRNLLISSFGRKFVIPQKYLWATDLVEAKSKGKRRECSLNENALVCQGTKSAKLSLSGEEYELFSVLLSDFYSSTRLTRLSHALNPGLPFDPFHFPDQALKLVKRVEKRLLDKKLPLAIKHRKGDFLQLELKTGVNFTVTQTQLVEVDFTNQNQSARLRMS